MKSEEKKILFLTLKKEFYDQIKSGMKTSEFREYKEYWIKRLTNSDGSFKTFDIILFKNGYGKNAPQVRTKFKGIKIVKEKINLFRNKKYFEILLGEIINDK